MTNIRKMVDTLKDSDQDFEWYPTTDKMLECIKKDLLFEDKDNYQSILDCGAGDGRALSKLTKGKKYAIEKAEPLLQVLDKNIFVVGTEFDEQTLMDKKVDVVFSNPPYSVYDQWAIKIVKEANSGYIYLVIPTRWQDCEPLQAALKEREAKTSVIGSFDFLQGDRAARAKVNIVKIELLRSGSWGSSTPKVDPFALWFDEHFKLEINQKESADYEINNRATESLKDKVSRELTKGTDLVQVLYEFYQRDMEKLLTTYQSLGNVDVDILLELDVNIDGVREALKLKISGLKDRYWHELFNNFDKVTDKLTVGSRKKLLDTLTAHTHVDFTVSNAYAVIIWVIKNANEYFDNQLINMMEYLIEKSNITLYKSNKKTFGDEQWRYCRTPEDLNKFSLECRIVTDRLGGLKLDWYNKDVNGLSERASEFLNDICTIAGNIGFDTVNMHRANSFEWDVHVKNVFEYKDIHTGECYPLFEAKAFKNGNVHIKFNQKFMCRLNVEFGRLKGWIKSPKEAAKELDIPLDIASEGFKQNLRIDINPNLLLGSPE